MIPVIKADGFGELFKFENPKDRIHARFVGRRRIRTQTQSAAPILDVDIIESVQVDSYGNELAGPTGPHSIFESKGITQLLDDANLQPDDEFILCFDGFGKNNFKRFGLKILKRSEGNEGGDGTPMDDIPLEDGDDVPFGER